VVGWIKKQLNQATATHNYFKKIPKFSILLFIMFKISFHIFLQSMLHPSSEQADKIYRLFNYFNVAAAAMLALVSFLVIFICIKFKQKKGDIKEAEFKISDGKLEILMITVPAMLLGWFLYQTVEVMHAVEPPVTAGSRPDVIITGHQWWWEVEYPAARAITANEVHLPVGRSLLMEMRSADVIHDWWVPALGNKMDVIPNVVNYLSLHINRSGEYAGACSEFCGAQHAWMRIKVVAQSEADFDRWLSANAVNADHPIDSLARSGEFLFQTRTCGSCHRVSGTNATGDTGPDLSHLGSREDLLTGLMKNNEKNLSEWISHPQKIKPGAHMPDFIFSKDNVNAIVHYLSQLK
jgi:cytochrome c oxidase subunit 2